MGRCSSCKGEKPDDGFKSCEVCRARARAWRKANPERAAENDRRKREANPELYRRLDREKVARHIERNREAINERRRAQYAASPERERQRQREFRASLPEEERRRRDREGNAKRDRQAVLDNARFFKARRRQAPLTLAAKTYWRLELIGDPCVYCGVMPEERTVEHIDPLVPGQWTNWDHIALACRSCNSSKRDRPLLIFLLARCS